MLKQISPTVRGIVIGAVAVALLWFGSSLGSGAVASEPGTSFTADATDADTTVVEARVIDQFSTLDPISVDELPPEAVITLDLIESGGPYPYRKDDSTFQNREGILPPQDRGYYREYTVDTPGSSDRGARRIVAGSNGDLYYTEDHYASFQEVTP